MSTIAVKPLGKDREYSGGQKISPPKFVMRQGYEAVNKLYIEYVNFPRRVRYWNYRKKVIDLALKVLSAHGDTNWFLLQVLNTGLHKQNQAFLKDTVRFIATGRRRISINAWPVLVTSEVASEVGSSPEIDLAETLKEFGYDYNTSNANLVQRWCSQPNGFNDLICTLNILYGSQPEAVSR